MAAGTITQTRIALDIQPPTARLTLQHPPLNVIDIAMMDELAQALAGIEARSDVSTVILSGAGKAFSVGVDVAAHTPDKVEGMLARFHAVIRALVSSKRVTIAAVRGHCLGGGAESAKQDLTEPSSSKYNKAGHPGVPRPWHYRPVCHSQSTNPSFILSISNAHRRGNKPIYPVLKGAMNGRVIPVDPRKMIPLIPGPNTKMMASITLRGLARGRPGSFWWIHFQNERCHALPELIWYFPNRWKRFLFLLHHLSFVGTKIICPQRVLR